MKTQMYRQSQSGSHFLKGLTILIVNWQKHALTISYERSTWCQTVFLCPQLDHSMIKFSHQCLQFNRANQILKCSLISNFTSPAVPGDAPSRSLHMKDFYFTFCNHLLRLCLI